MPHKDFGGFKDEFKMNVFVLCTGRCGSMTFAKACGHISNYTSAHESRKQLKPKAPRERFIYLDFHIEVDNRLAWFLGTLNEIYGTNAFYVHLKREMKDTDKLLSMMEALHEMAQDRLIDLMNRDLNNNGTEND